jgi:hypothetical protein
LRAAVILYLAFIRPSARSVPRSDLRCVADRVRSGSARAVVRRRCVGKARVERAGAPKAQLAILNYGRGGGTLLRTSFAVLV